MRAGLLRVCDNQQRSPQRPKPGWTASTSGTAEARALPSYTTKRHCENSRKERFLTLQTPFGMDKMRVFPCTVKPCPPALPRFSHRLYWTVPTSWTASISVQPETTLAAKVTLTRSVLKAVLRGSEDRPLGKLLRRDLGRRLRRRNSRWRRGRSHGAVRLQGS
jgi:hypothetical protein